MSITAAEAERLESAYKARILEAETDDGNAEESRSIAENQTEEVSYDTIHILAKGVLAGTLTIGEATKLGSGAASGRKYQRVNRRIKTEMERQSIRYVPLTPEKQQRLKVKH